MTLTGIDCGWNYAKVVAQQVVVTTEVVGEEAETTVGETAGTVTATVGMTETEDEPNPAAEEEAGDAASGACMLPTFQSHAVGKIWKISCARLGMWFMQMLMLT